MSTSLQPRQRILPRYVVNRGSIIYRSCHKKAGRLSQATAAAHAGGVLATIPEAEGGAFYAELDLARPAPPC